MTITPAEKTRLLRRFGGTNPFSDPEIDDIWDEVAGASSTAERYEAALAAMFESVLNDATKLHDYTQNETSEKKRQIFENLEKRYAQYKPAYDAAIGARRQIARNTMRPRPHQRRDLPATDHRRGQVDSEIDDRLT